MDKDKTYKLTVKAVISPRDPGLQKLMREYQTYKKVLISRVRHSVRRVIQDKSLTVYSQQKWMVDKKLNEYLRSLPFHPMPIANQSYWLEENLGHFLIHIKTGEGEAVCRLLVPKKHYESVQKACGKKCPHHTENSCEFEKCPFKTSKMCKEINPYRGEAKLIEDRKYGWVNCHITIRQPKQEPYTPKGWIGVDVGWKKLATSILATCNPHLTFKHPTVHGKQFKTQIIQLRHLLKQYARKGKAWKKWNFRLKNTIKNAVGMVAKEIVAKAKKFKAGVAMENLTFKSTTKGYLVPRYKLMTRVKILCEREGIPFKLVSAQYTSIICPKCDNQQSRKRAEEHGKDKKEQRKLFQTKIKHNRNKERFKCIDCGYQADSDIIGAMNVAKRALNRTPKDKEG